MSAEIFYTKDQEALLYPIVILEGDEIYPKLLYIGNEVYATKESNISDKCRQCDLRDTSRCNIAPRCNQNVKVYTYIRGNADGFDRQSVLHGTTKNELIFVKAELKLPIQKIDTQEVEI